MRATAALVALALVLGLHGHAAAADDGREASRAAFRHGVEELKRGNYANARLAFIEAYRLFAHPSILLNLGVARAKTGEWVEAERDLAHFMAEDPGASPEEVAAARTTLSDVRKHLGTIRLRVTPALATAAVDGKPVALLPSSFVELRVTEGTHVIAAQADRYESVETSVALRAEQAVEVDLALLDAPAVPVPGRRDGVEARKTFGWALVGLSVVAVGVGIWSGLRAGTLADQYNTPGNSGFQDPAKRSDGIAHRTGADVAFTVAIASALGATFLLLDPFGKRSMSLGVGPGFAAARGSF